MSYLWNTLKHSNTNNLTCKKSLKKLINSQLQDHISKRQLKHQNITLFLNDSDSYKGPPSLSRVRKKLLNMTSMCQCRHDRDTSAWRPSTSPPTPVSDCRLLADNRPHTNWTPPNQDPRLSDKECDGYTLGEPHPHHLLAPPLPRRRLLSRISTLTTLSVQGLLRNAGRWSPKEKKDILE